MPCSRSPTTEYAARADGTIAGMMSMYSREIPMRVSSLALLDAVLTVKRSIVGTITKMSGRTAMV